MTTTATAKFQITGQSKVYGSKSIRCTVREKLDGAWVLYGSWTVPALHPYTGERLSTKQARLSYIVENFIEPLSR